MNHKMDNNKDELCEFRKMHKTPNTDRLIAVMFRRPKPPYIKKVTANIVHTLDGLIECVRSCQTQTMKERGTIKHINYLDLTLKLHTLQVDGSACVE